MVFVLEINAIEGKVIKTGEVEEEAVNQCVIFSNIQKNALARKP